MAGSVRHDSRRRAVGGRPRIGNAPLIRSRKIRVKRVGDRGGFTDEIVIGIDNAVIPEPLVVDAPNPVGSADRGRVGHEGHVQGIGSIHVMKIILRVLQALRGGVVPRRRSSQL